MLALFLISCSLYAPTSTDPPPLLIEVVRGDTLGKLAKKHGVSVDELMEWNNLHSDLIEVGQRLEIHLTPGKAPTTAKPRHPRPRPVKSSPRDASPNAPVVPSLTSPPPKPCRALPTGEDLGEQGAVAATGLSHQQVSSTMAAFIPRAQSCLYGLTSAPTGTLSLAITVGCDGVVDRVQIQRSDDWPAANGACFAQAIRKASFPAHGLPDGDTFIYPLRMQ